MNLRLLFIALSTATLSIAQGSQRQTTVNGSQSTDNGFFNYSATITYRMQDDGYGESPTELKVGITHFEVTRIIHKGKDAATILSSFSYPLQFDQAQADISGSVFLTQGSSSFSTGFSLGSVRAGGLDNYSFSPTEKQRVFNTFGQDVSYNDVNVSLSNVQLTDILAYRVREITDQMDRIIREQEQEKKRQAEEEKKRQEEEKRKKEEEQKAKEDEEEKEAEETRKSEIEKAEEKRSREKEQEEARKAREAEEERKKQARIDEYNNRVEAQRDQNKAIAAASAASSATFLYIIGGFVYSNMGQAYPEDIYKGNNGFLSINYGFGISSFPMAFESISESINQNGDIIESTGGDTRNALTIDFNVNIEGGYEMDNVRVEGFAGVQPGFSPIFDSFNYSYNYGGNVYGGFKNIKLLAGYESGSHNYTKSDILDPEQFGSGKAETPYQRMRYGISFAFYGSPNSARRDHISLGIMEEYITRESTSVNAGRSMPDEALIGLLDNEDNDVSLGYFLEWNRDLTSKFYLRFFPNYPVTGEIGGFSERDNQLFLQVGFIRSFGRFFNKN